MIRWRLRFTRRTSADWNCTRGSIRIARCTVHRLAENLRANHISKTHPELVRSYGKYLWLDPGEREVQEYSLRS